MNSPARPFYSRLRGNEGLLQQGVPIFTYHKVASRPRGAKWRSLYLSPKLFAQQMRELAAAGFTTARLSDPLPAAGNPEKKFILTFDDGYLNVLQHAAGVLRQYNFTAIQFIVADQIGGTNAWDVAEGEVSAPLMNDAQIREWLQAGHEIGSHTLTHPRLSHLVGPTLREEVGASKRRLEDRFGVPIRHFCYPYGDYDQRVIEEVAHAGYETACAHLQSGVATAGSPRFELPRIEARYPKRSLKAFFSRLFPQRATLVPVA